MRKKEREEVMEMEEDNVNNSGLDASVDTLRILEALLFASDELMTAAKLKAILPNTPDVRQIRKMIDKINVQLQKERHPFEIVEIGGGYQFRTVVYYHPWVRQIFKEKAAKKLSIQALECLAIIAYKQPISKAEIEAIRGVVSDGAMKTLLEKKLVTISGRSDKPGRPLLYGSTNDFLKYFGLNKIDDLPRIEEFEAIAREKIEDFSSEELQNEEIEISGEETEIQAQEATPQAEEQVITPAAQEEPVPEGSSLFEVAVEQDSIPEQAASEEEEEEAEELQKEAVSDFDVVDVDESVTPIEEIAQEEDVEDETELGVDFEVKSQPEIPQVSDLEEKPEVAVEQKVEEVEEEVALSVEEIETVQIEKGSEQKNSEPQKSDSDEEEILEVVFPEKKHVDKPIDLGEDDDDDDFDEPKVSFFKRRKKKKIEDLDDL